MSIRETFSNSFDWAVINESDKGAEIQISTVLGYVFHVAFQRVLSNGTVQTFIWLRFGSP